MKHGLIAAAALLLLSNLFITTNAFAHDDASRVSFEREDQASYQAGKIDLVFQMIDLKNKIVLTDNDLMLMHEKKLHFFAYDPALKEFRHEHPTFQADSMWHVTTNLSVTGDYWIWAQGMIASDGVEFAASERLQVLNGTPANPTPPILGDVRAATDGISKATLSGERIIAKSMSMLMLDLTRTDGTQPIITPYLGETAHIIAVSDDADSLIHVHPMGSGGTQLMFHFIFPAAGNYRLWVQFNDGGVLKTVPLSVAVFDQ